MKNSFPCAPPPSPNESCCVGRVGGGGVPRDGGGRGRFFRCNPGLVHPRLWDRQFTLRVQLGQAGLTGDKYPQLILPCQKPIMGVYSIQTDTNRGRPGLVTEERQFSQAPCSAPVTPSLETRFWQKNRAQETVGRGVLNQLVQAAVNKDNIQEWRYFHHFC
jgi:hypothetical protein